MRLSTFKTIISTMNERLEHGCGTHGCQIKQPGGQAVNIQCRCTIRDFSKDLWWVLEQMDGKTQWEKEDQ
jgi:hypothetical protein